MSGERSSTGYVFAGTRHGNPIGGLDDDDAGYLPQAGNRRSERRYMTFEERGQSYCAGLCGQPCMDRCLNHRKNSVSATYDRWQYAAANAQAWETVAQHILELVKPRASKNRLREVNSPLPSLVIVRNYLSISGSKTERWSVLISHRPFGGT